MYTDTRSKQLVDEATKSLMHVDGDSDVMKKTMQNLEREEGRQVAEARTPTSLDVDAIARPTLFYTPYPLDRQQNFVT